MDRRLDSQEPHPPDCNCAECADVRAGSRRSQQSEASSVTFSAELTLEEAYRGTARAVTLPDGRRIEIAVPPGVDDGNRVHVSPDGNTGIDVYLAVSVMRHPSLRRQGPDLFTDIRVSGEDALRGAQVTVQGLSAAFQMTVSPNTEDGRQFRLTGHGMPSLSQPNQNGDLYVTVKVAPPFRVPGPGQSKNGWERMKLWLGVLVTVGIVVALLYDQLADESRNWLCADENRWRWLPAILKDSLCEGTGYRVVQDQSRSEVIAPVAGPTPVPVRVVPLDSPMPTVVPTSTLAPTPAPVPVSIPAEHPTVRPPVSPASARLPTPVVMQPSVLANFPNGAYLEESNPGAARAVKSLPWVQDSIDASEGKHLEYVLETAVFSRRVFHALIETPWVRDGFSKDEEKAFKDIRVISQVSDQHAETVMRLPWIQDGLSEEELLALDGLAGVAFKSPSNLPALLLLEWVQEEISEPEADAIQSIESVGWHTSDSLDVLIAFPWIEDGVAGPEVYALGRMAAISQNLKDNVKDVLSYSWVTDGVTSQEAEVIGHIASISFNRDQAAQAIIAMPFLETLGPADRDALMSLRQLAGLNPTMFDRVIGHQTLASGISDDWVQVVATLRGASQQNAPLVDVLLDPRRVTVEKRHIALPLRGELLLAIIRTGPGSPHSMDLLEGAVRSAEDFMDAPFPTAYVGLLFEDAVVPGQAGTNFGTHIAVLPKYDAGHGSGVEKHAAEIIAHEVAHYYWSGNADWVDEGAADLMASISEKRRTASPVTATNYPCPYADSISELERIGASDGSLEFRCNYALGERLFLELYKGMGAETFKVPFRALYLEPGEAGIDHLRTAFRENVPQVAVAASERVISHWYDGGGPRGPGWNDQTEVHDLAGLNGQIDRVYISLSRDGQKVASFLASDVTDVVELAIKYSYNLAHGSRTVDLNVLVYYEDGFLSDRREVSIEAFSGYIGGSLHTSIGPAHPRVWKSGTYQVYIYQNGDRKVGELTFSVN